jgi:phosphopantetheine adenylyltransferase
MPRILVVANETIAGASLIEAVRKRVEQGDASFIVCVPRTRPHHGSIIYDDFVHQVAQVRIDLARAWMRDQMGVEVVGEVGDPDPYTAAMDAIREYEPDEIIVSTKPATVSGWLRRDLVERITDASGLPVEHVVTDIDREGLPFTVTLVVANRTASTDRLLNRLRERAGEAEQRPLFIVVVPQEGGEGQHANRARGRVNQFLDRARSAGLLAAGVIGDPDPYTATMNGLQLFRVDEVVISTLGPERSGWLRADLIDRVRKGTGLPVEHVISEDRDPASVN